MHKVSASSSKHTQPSPAPIVVAGVASIQQPIERTIPFSQAQAIVWQIKFILNQISSKKALNQASNEIESLSSKFGKDFDKYLLRELIEQIDLKDPVKAQKDKNEPFKIQLLMQELSRCSQKADFLSYFGEIAQIGFNDRLADFITELTKRLKLSQTNQILVSLSMVESCREDSQPEAIKILKQKLLDYYHGGRPEPLPDYALHRLLFLLSTHPEFNGDENKENIQQYLVDSNSLKPASHISLRGALLQDLMNANASVDEPSICLAKEGNGIDNLDKSYRMLEPWQLLIDLGHFSSYNYNYLLKTLEDFKDINERTMARTLLNLAIHHSGCNDQASQIAQSTFEANKKGDSTLLRKDIQDKKNLLNWSVDNLVRAFRELYSHLNWQKVFEALSELTEDVSLDAKAFAMFKDITNKSKPQNLPYPLTLILQTQWASPLLQLSFIENSIQFYIEKKDKSIQFSKAGERRQEIIDDLTGIKEKVSMEFLHVWLSVDLVERLLVLSDTHYFHRVRQLFEAPLKQIPEYLLLTLSLCKPTKGCLMIDELLSLLLPQFLGNHINSILVLQALWKNNQALMIRAICELCRHDQRIMNLSRVLDITQEVKESLMPIVDCEDYYFAVNLAILAGKRDFLHYDVWLQRRISDVGTPFIKALLKYIKEHIIQPITEFQRRSGSQASASSSDRGLNELSSDQMELQKQQVLERSHLSREKLAMTIENLQNLQNRNNPLIKHETLDQIREVVTKLGEFFPGQFAQTQNSEEIDNAANEYFHKVFSAEHTQVDQKIAELIETMQRFRVSKVKMEQEIYACMLHSLFDEYRFLHKYPTQYLEKIAKVFGAIIKNRIMDGQLQEIAVKFVVEAFRREGKRMKFGVIVTRQILDMLPEFPQFFESLYEQRNQISSVDPSLIKDIEDLYERTMPKSARTRAISGAVDERSAFAPEEAAIEQQSIEERKDDTRVSSQRQGLEKAKAAAESSNLQQMPRINESEFLANYQQNVQGQTQPVVQQAQLTKKEAKAQQKGQIVEPIPQKGTLPPSSTQAPAFNPTYKVRNVPGTSVVEAQSLPSQAQTVPQQATETSISQPAPPQLAATSSQGLNPQSVAFRRPVQSQTAQPSTAPSTSAVTAPTLGLSQSQPMTFQPSQIPQSSSVGPQIPNLSQAPSAASAAASIISVIPFRPASKSPAPTSAIQMGMPSQLPFNQQNYQMQLTIEQKLQRALQENAKVKLEDVVEDSNLPGPNQEDQEAIKFICNSTGKNNFSEKLEDLKKKISQNGQVNLMWFIHFILTKRLGSVNLYPIYIDMIKQIGQKDSISITIGQAMEIFKKCMLVDEESLNRVAHRAQVQTSLVKQYLGNLGSFIGQLTVAGNRPLYAKELDLKQLLVEGFQSSRMKLIVTFACRILKECSKSTIFKFQNPWVKAILEVLKEIYDWAAMNHQIADPTEVIMEIDGLFKSFNINNANDIQHQNFVKAYYYPHQASNPSQHIEVSHLRNKPNVVPTIQVLHQTQQINEYQRPSSTSPLPGMQFAGGPFPLQPGRMMTPGQLNDFELQRQQVYTNIQKIFQKVVISNEFLDLLHVTPGKLTSNQEQLLRKIIADAVDQSILDILPPVVDRSVTIALITTRELVLKDFAFDANPDKILKAADLIVQNLAGSLALVTCREPLKMQLTTNLKKSLHQQLNLSLFIDEENQQQQPLTLTETLIQDLGSQASKDNLELGCKLIKKAVIQKALTKVREDQLITGAIEQRQAARSPEEFRRKVFSDEMMIAQFADLPQQLKPNPDGPTDAQFQVYQDFARLNNQSMGIAGAGHQVQIQSTDYQGSRVNGDLQLDPNEDIETYLKQFEAQLTFDKRFESLLSAKLEAMNTKPDQTEQTKKLVNYCESIFQTTCEILAAQSQQQVIQSQEKAIKILDFLTFVTATLKNEDMQGKLTQKFLALDASIVNNANITLDFMRRGIVSHAKWDSSIATYIREQQQFISSSTNIPKEMKDLFNFLREFLTMAVSSGTYNFNYQHFPHIMHVIQKLSESDSNIAQFFQIVIQDYRQRTIWTKETLRDYFNEWAVISFEEASNPQRQEQEVNRFFNNLKQQGLYKDHRAVQMYCKTMLELSVERSLYYSDGVTKRPADRLVYRYIESLLNFLVVSLMKFTSTREGMNKHEFLAQVFEAIFQVIDEDHRNRRAEFNQKPYYRILINILKVISNPTTFNPKTHTQVLFSLADLFIKLNPKDYPAFSFAWLELISHKLFMPYFLQSQSQQMVSQGGAQMQGGMNQPRRPGQPGANQSQQTIQQQDNTLFQKWFRYKDIILHLFTFLKSNMIIGQPMTEPLAKFYEATLRIVLVIKNDYPEFLVDFHFNFVNNLPDHCIQLRNIILSSQPRNIPIIDPFSKNLKVDTLPEIYQAPRSQSNYENYLQLMNLREDLEKYFRTKERSITQVIADKLMQAEEYINGRKRINSSVFNAVALFIQNYAQQNKGKMQQAQKECYELLKQIILLLNSETRLCLLNSIVNELRFINAHTYLYSWMVIFLFSDSDEAVQEQISRILIERLQTHDPHPWGLCITFRELLQNPKYSFASKGFVQRNINEIEQLMQTKLSNFNAFWQNNKQMTQQMQQQQVVGGGQNQ